jgi:hypothetical protein
MLLGACAGVVLPVVVLVQVEELSSAVMLPTLFLGPAFGAFFVYFLERYRSPWAASGRVMPFAVAGAVAGGAATALAYDFGVVSAVWNVAVGGVAGAGLGALIGWEASAGAAPPTDAGPRILSGRSLFLKAFARWLADEVWDAGDHLVIRRGKEELIVQWDQIAAVEESQHRLGEFITIHFNQRVGMGPSVAFCPPFRLSWFIATPSPIVAHLQARIAARST